MNDFEFYNTCAIAAMRELIAKVPLADKDAGQDADGIGYEICKSADRYAADMVRIRRERLGPIIPEAKESNPERSGPTADAASKPDVAGSADAKLLDSKPLTGEINHGA